MRGRRGIVIGGMVIGLLMGCNNGGEERLAAQKRLGEIGRSAEKAFYLFMELVSDVLGFNTKVGAKKEDVAQHFTDLGKKLGEASNELEEVAVKAVTDDDKDGILSKAIREAVDAAKKTLEALKTNLESLGTISTGDPNVVGYTHNSAGSGTTVADVEIKKAYKGLKGIVETAIKDGGIKTLEAGSKTLTAENKTGAKILATSGSNPGTSDAEKAAAILATVSGKQMLASIVESTDSDAALGGAANQNTSAVSFALGGSDGNLSTAHTPKAAAVAGGIALRSLVKDGKLAAGAASAAQGGEKEIQGVGITAVNKLLVAVEDIIKKTVNKTLLKVKDAIDKSRSSKEVVK